MSDKFLQKSYNCHTWVICFSNMPKYVLISLPCCPASGYFTSCPNLMPDLASKLGRLDTGKSF